MKNKNTIDESEQLRESLLDLARANTKERDARTEAEALLAGLNALTNYDNRDKMFEDLLSILRNQIGFENAFILSAAAKNESFQIVASTTTQQSEVFWSSGEVSKRITLGQPLAFFNIDLVPEWQNQAISFRQGVSSALHVLLRDHQESAILICTHSQRGYFTEKHLKLSARFAPLASQALMNLNNRLELEKINSQLHIEIEQRQKAQAQVVNSSKMAALGEMAGGIAHEINTPLGAIALNAEMIESENSRFLQPSKNISKRVKAILETSDRIAKIINGLKGFSRDAKNDDSEIFAPQKLIENTISLCGEKFKNNNVQLLVDRDDEDTLIQGQIVQLSQTLLNLLNNAYDAIMDFEEKWIRIKVITNDQNIQIKVTDCGNGIPPAVVDKIFQPFFTTKDIGRGTGLGLSISRNIIKNHQGVLFYDETSAHTCFTIQLPRFKSEKVAV